jgi:hypothetical protein
MRLIESELQRRLNEAMAALYANPLNVELQNTISEIADRLQVFLKHTVEGQRVWSRVKWMRVGNTSSKEFYQTHK